MAILLGGAMAFARLGVANSSSPARCGGPSRQQAHPRGPARARAVPRGGGGEERTALWEECARLKREVESDNRELTRLATALDGNTLNRGPKP